MEPRRQMGLASAIAIVTGESIALGIFLTPAAMAKSLGPPLLLAAVWCGMALIAICGTLLFGTGGAVSRWRRVCLPARGIRRTGRVSLWLDVGCGDRSGPGRGVVSGRSSLCAVDYPISPAHCYVSACGDSVRVSGVINYAGTRLSSRLMATANLLKIAVLFALVAWAFVSGHASTTNLLPLATRRPGSEALFGAIAGATVNAFFSFGGWWEAGKLAGEVREPKRTLPLAFTVGVLLVTAVYLLVSFAFLSVVPLERIVSNTAFVAQFGQALFGSAGGKILSACVLLGCWWINGVTMAHRACITRWRRMARSSGVWAAASA